MFANGSGTLVVEGELQIRGDELEAGGSLTLDSAGSMDLDGANIDLRAGTTIDLTAPTISLTGLVTASQTILGTITNAQFADQAQFALHSPCCSDRRWKAGIEPVGGVLNQVLELRAKQYYWNESSPLSADQELHFGFIAQEVLEVFPNLVKDYTDGEHYLLDYVQIVPLLVESLRELRAEKDDEIARLNAQNQDLEARLARMESIEADLAEVQRTLTQVLEER